MPATKSEQDKRRGVGLKGIRIYLQVPVRNICDRLCVGCRAGTAAVDAIVNVG